MAIDIITGFILSAQEPIDARYGPYATIGNALTALPQLIRYNGLLVDIEDPTTKLISKYGFSGGVLDSHLVPLSTISGATGWDGTENVTVLENIQFEDVAGKNLLEFARTPLGHTVFPDMPLLNIGMNGSGVNMHGTLLSDIVFLNSLGIKGYSANASQQYEIISINSSDTLLVGDPNITMALRAGSIASGPVARIGTTSVFTDFKLWHEGNMVPIPPDGPVGYVLSKASASSYDYQWTDIGSSGFGDMMKATYDTNSNGIVDNSALVGGHSVETDVPAGALFTDTPYNDSAVYAAIALKKDDFTENGAFNKDFGISSTTVSRGDHTHANITTTFLALTDAPDAYGTTGQIPAMNSAENGLEWVASQSGPQGERGYGFISSAYDAGTGKVTFTSENSNSFGLVTGDLRGAPGVGTDGAAATVDVHPTTITEAAGGNSDVSNTGSTSAAVFQFTIPRGDKGEPGTNGSGVSILGSDTIAVIKGKTGNAGDMWISTDAGVDDDGTAVAIGDGIVWDVINTKWVTVGPIRGPIGPEGPGGSTGTAAIISGATISGLDWDAVPIITMGGSPSDRTFTFQIPKGEPGVGVDGTNATISVKSTTTGAAGSSANVTVDATSTSTDKKLNFIIPRGDKGATGLGLISGGTNNQLLTKDGSSNYATKWTSLPTSKPISFITGLQSALDDKVDDSQVLTDVPAAALFTDTVYNDTVIWAAVNGKEPSLGNPATSGHILSSTSGGTRSWIPAPTGIDTNYYLSDVSRAGVVVTWTVAGADNHAITFGSNAFTDTVIKTYGVFTTTVDGLVPKSGTNTAKFLRGDATWADAPNSYLTSATRGTGANINRITWAVTGQTNPFYEFGANAFTDTSIPTNNNQLTNGAGYITSYLDTKDMGDGFKITDASAVDQFTIKENNELSFEGAGTTSVSFDSGSKKVTISSTASTYSVFSTDDGLAPGIVAPDTTKFLRSDGSWAKPPDTKDMGSGFKIANAAGTEKFKVLENDALRFGVTGGASVSFDAATKKITIGSVTYSDFTTDTSGLVPHPGAAGVAGFLRGDGTWVDVSTANDGKFTVEGTASDIAITGTLYSTANQSGNTKATFKLTTTGVTAGDYTNPTISIDSKGRISAAAQGSGGVSSVVGTSPISVVTTLGVATVSISKATSSTNGYLSYQDWSTFNSKTSNIGDITAVNITAGTGISGSKNTASGTHTQTLSHSTGNGWNHIPSGGDDVDLVLGWESPGNAKWISGNGHNHGDYVKKDGTSVMTGSLKVGATDYGSELDPINGLTVKVGGPYTTTYSGAGITFGNPAGTVKYSQFKLGMYGSDTIEWNQVANVGIGTSPISGEKLAVVGDFYTDGEIHSPNFRLIKGANAQLALVPEAGSNSYLYTITGSEFHFGIGSSYNDRVISLTATAIETQKDIKMLTGTALKVGGRISNNGDRLMMQLTNDGAHMEIGPVQDGGDIEFQGGIASVVSMPGALNVTGNITSIDDVVANSDIRLKDDLKPLDSKTILEGLHGYNYHRKDLDKRQNGLIAQDVEKVLPEAVSVANDAMGTKSIAYNHIIAVLVEDNKRLQRELDELKKLVLDALR